MAWIAAVSAPDDIAVARAVASVAAERALLIVTISYCTVAEGVDKLRDFEWRAVVLLVILVICTLVLPTPTALAMPFCRLSLKPGDFATANKIQKGVVKKLRMDNRNTDNKTKTGYTEEVF